MVPGLVESSYSNSNLSGSGFQRNQPVLEFVSFLYYVDLPLLRLQCPQTTTLKLKDWYWKTFKRFISCFAQ